MTKRGRKKGCIPWNKAIWPEKSCLVCEQLFKAKPYRASAMKYCSSDCYGVAIRGKVPKSVFKKGRRASPKTEFKKGKNHQYFGKRGKEASNWKGGITPLATAIRECFKYRQWHSDVLTRDRFLCQDCGIGHTTHNRLEVDHIKSFMTIIRENKIKSLKEAEECEEFWNINNGRTLCHECHTLTPTYGNKKL